MKEGKNTVKVSNILSRGNRLVLVTDLEAIEPGDNELNYFLPDENKTYTRSAWEVDDLVKHLGGKLPTSLANNDAKTRIQLILDLLAPAGKDGKRKLKDTTLTVICEKRTTPDQVSLIDNTVVQKGATFDRYSYEQQLVEI